MQQRLNYNLNNHTNKKKVHTYTKGIIRECKTKKSNEKRGSVRSKQMVMWKGAIVTPEGVLDNGLVVVQGEKIVFAGYQQDWTGEWSTNRYEIKNGWICPGLIDIHIHGGRGYDTMDGSSEAMQTIAEHLVQHGVTGFLATTMTGDLKHLEKVVEQVAQTASHLEATGNELSAQILGIHLEGPWINYDYKGAQNGKYVEHPTIEDARRIYEASNGWLRMVTMAPEQKNALKLIRYLKEQGVKISIGHSGAVFEEVEQAVQNGGEHFTHCFNAMKGLHHREPGVVGAAMYFDHVTCELIADGIHVHPIVMSILYKLKKHHQLVLVSDGMRATGMKKGIYDLGGQTVYVSEKGARLEDGTLAGSILTLNQAVANIINWCGVPLHEAVSMASLTPAKVIGEDHRKGMLKAGYDADLTIMDEDFGIIQTVVGGRVVYTDAYLQQS